MRSNARVAAFFAALGVAMAGILAVHAGRGAWRWLAGEPWGGFSPRYRSAPDRAAARIAALARALAARRCRPEPRHALREIPLHPRLQFPGIDAGAVPVPWPASMPERPAETVIDEALLAPLARPYLTYCRPGRAGAGMHQGAA